MATRRTGAEAAFVVAELYNGNEREAPTDEMDRPTLESPAVPSMASGVLQSAVMILGGANVGLLRPLAGQPVVLGREPDCDLWIPDDGVSRRHARLVPVEGGWEAEDLDSTNGTRVNGELIARCRLADGDRIVVGQTVVKFVSRRGVEAEYSSRLYDMSIRDALTGLHNRRYLEDRLRAETAFAQRHGTLLSALVIDLDHFKRVNDTHGHLVGDRVLSETAAALRRAVRTEDVLVRWGGEEFVLLVRAIPAGGVALLGERLRREIENMCIRHHEETILVTASVGTCTDRGGSGWNARDLLAAADRALYRAKAEGRNRVCAAGLEEREADTDPGQEEYAE